MLSKVLENYLSELGLSVPKTLSFEFVQALQCEHVARFSFNSVAVVLGNEISLDVERIGEKILEQRMGGYCFEHNKLTFELLKTLGYDVQFKLARVLNNQLDRPVGRTHRVTLLRWEGKQYLVDTGFGGNGPISPLCIDTQDEQASGLEQYRIVSLLQDEFDLQVVKEGEYFTLYRFDLACYSDADCELGHFYSHRHPSAVFVNNLLVTRKTYDHTYSLLNSTFKIKTASAEQVKHVHSAVELRDVLLTHFYLPLDLVIAEHVFDRFVLPDLEALSARGAL